jgi:hypothetical protein
LSLDVSVHDPAHRVKPAAQVKPHVVPEQDAVAFGGVLHAAQKPPQHIPAEQDVPSSTSPVATHVGCPVLHEIIPVWHALPLGLHAAPSMHAVHAPSKQISPAPQVVPLGAFPSDPHADEPDEHDRTPILHALPSGLHSVPDTQATQPPSAHA